MSAGIPAYLPFVKFCIFVLADWTPAKHPSLLHGDSRQCALNFPSVQRSVNFSYSLARFPAVLHLADKSSAVFDCQFCLCKEHLLCLMQIKAPEFCHRKSASKNWRNWWCSALFLRAIKGFITHSLHASPLKCKAFSSKEWLGVRSSLVHV